METFNLFSGDTDVEPAVTDPPGYRHRSTRLGPKIGAARMGMSIYDLPPGQAICPYHFEWTDEEWLIVLSGRATLRDPEGEHPLEPGDVVCFPAGPEGAHQVANRSQGPARVAILSTKSAVGIVEYPDSDKLGVWAGGSRRHLLGRSRQLDYWDGETA